MMQFGAYLSPKRGLLASACLPRGLGTVVLSQGMVLLSHRSNNNRRMEVRPAI